MAMMLTPEPPPWPWPLGSSESWIALMGRSLDSRRKRFKMLEAYYRGKQDTQNLASDAWRGSGLGVIFPDLNANHSRLIIRAAQQRLHIIGFRLADELDADTEAWRIWMRNDMETFSSQAHTESLVKGECPVLVQPDPSDPTVPRITPQDPTEAIVWHARGDRRIRLAALKTWIDEWTGQRLFTLFLPDRVERWREAERGTFDRWAHFSLGSPAPRFVRREARSMPFMSLHRLGEVPMVSLPNDPRFSGAPEGEHEVVLPLIDLYTKTLMDMAVTSHEMAYPQRYATGVDDTGAEEPVFDPETDQVVESPTPATRTGQRRIVTSPDVQSKFGQFAAADLAGYVRALESYRADIATVTFTPYHYVLNMPSSVPPSGEAITAAEAPLVDHVRQHGIDKGTPWRHLMSMSFRIVGDAARAQAMASGSVVWADPERRTESQHIDALGKAVTMLGLPIEAAWDMLPATPQDKERWRRYRQGQSELAPIDNETGEGAL